MRYGLPPFVRLRPGPAGAACGAAAAASMTGDHRVMVAVMGEMLRGVLDG